MSNSGTLRAKFEHFKRPRSLSLESHSTDSLALENNENRQLRCPK